MRAVADELFRLDALGQAERVRRGELTPAELVEAAIARIEVLDPKLGALVTPQLERAREAARSQPARGPLGGVPFLLKDLGANHAGDPCYYGMRALREAGWREPQESWFAAQLREAGLITLGRTNTPELGLLPTTEPTAFWPSRNPWRPSHSPGGSSGGSAAAVASGMVSVAHASDGGGSIRIPASHCGLVGLKPSRGRSSFGPALGERWLGFAVEGFLSRSVRDTAVCLDQVSGSMPGDPYTAPPLRRPLREEVGADPGRLRIGWMTQAPRQGELHADCAAAARAAAQLLESLGHHVEESHPAALDDPAAVKGFAGVVFAATARALDAWGEAIGRPLGPEDVEPGTWQLAEGGRTLSAPELLEAVATNHRLSRSIAGWWQEQGFDLLLTPTCAAPPPPLGHFAIEGGDVGRSVARAVAYSAFTSPFNVTGQPAVSLPLHWNAEGLPVGVQLVAAFAREDLLVRVASQLERAQPWADRWPDIAAAGL